MNRSLLIFAVLLLFVFSKTNAQSAKPAFKEFTYINYYTVESKGMIHIMIEDYKHVNSEGIVECNISGYEGSGSSYSGEGSDTTYRLKDATIEVFNRLFDGKTSLKSHLITTNLPKGAHYAGPYECIYYTDLSGKTDHLLFIVSFLDPQLSSLIDNVIDYLPFAGYHPKAAYHNLAIENKIAEWYKTCNCMPKIELPPSVKELPPGIGSK